MASYIGRRKFLATLGGSRVASRGARATAGEAADHRYPRLGLCRMG